MNYRYNYCYSFYAQNACKNIATPAQMTMLIFKNIFDFTLSVMEVIFLYNSSRFSLVVTSLFLSKLLTPQTYLHK